MQGDNVDYDDKYVDYVYNYDDYDYDDNYDYYEWPASKFPP